MTQYLVYNLLIDNTQGTFTKTCTLPQGMNVLVGIQFYGTASMYYTVYDRAAANANYRFRRYALAAAENSTCCMAFQTRTMILHIVTPAQNGYYGLIVTVQNTPIENRFSENSDFQPVVGPRIK